MDKLGKTELYILQSFSEFSDVIEKIQNRPQFKEYARDGVELPKYDKEELKQVSVGAGVILGGLGGAATGTAGGLAAAGVTTSAVMALACWWEELSLILQEKNYPTSHLKHMEKC